MVPMVMMMVVVVVMIVVVVLDMLVEVMVPKPLTNAAVALGKSKSWTM